MAKYLQREVEKGRTAELQALLDAETEKKARLWAEGRDIWTGQPLTGRDAEDWLRDQFDGNEPDDLTDAEIEEILGVEEGDDFMLEFAASAILSFTDVSDDTQTPEYRRDYLSRRRDPVRSEAEPTKLRERAVGGDTRQLPYERTIIGPPSFGQPVQSPVRLRYVTAGGC